MATTCDSTQIDSLPNEFFEEGWKLSREEGLEQDAQIFRPVSYQEWKPSRFRDHYIFKQDKTGMFLSLSPNDAHKMVACTWTYDERTKVLIIASGAKDIKKLEVVSIEKDKLLLKRI